MKSIEVLRHSIPEGENPAIEVHAWRSTGDNPVMLADVRLREAIKVESAPAPAKHIKLLRRRAKMSHEAALEFALHEAEARGLAHIYDTTVGS